VKGCLKSHHETMTPRSEKSESSRCPKSQPRPGATNTIPSMEISSVSRETAKAQKKNFDSTQDQNRKRSRAKLATDGFLRMSPLKKDTGPQVDAG